MSTASAEEVGARRLVLPIVAYAIVLGLIGGVGFALWTGSRSGPPEAPGSNRAPAAIAKGAQMEALQGTGGPNLPPQPAKSAATGGATKMEPAALPPSSSSTTSNSGPAPSAGPTNKGRELAQESAVPPSRGETINNDQAASVTKQPEPPKVACTIDVGPWPSDSTEQAKAIQILMRDLGFYGGTTYGTLGPATRAAIRKFQLSADQAETGEPSEMLFESLKKKCAFPTP